MGELYSMASKKTFTFESNLEKILKKVEEKPHRVMNEIGLALVKEIRPNVNSRSSKGGKGMPFLKWKTQYWARREEKDLIVGYKNTPGMKYLYDQVDDPIKPAMVKNIPLYERLITAALDEIRKE